VTYIDFKEGSNPPEIICTEQADLVRQQRAEKKKLEEANKTIEEKGDYGLGGLGDQNNEDDGGIE